MQRFSTYKPAQQPQGGRLMLERFLAAGYNAALRWFTLAAK